MAPSLGVHTVRATLLWCGIVAGGAGGYIGGSFFGSVFQSGGEKLNENEYPPK